MGWSAAPGAMMPRAGGDYPILRKEWVTELNYRRELAVTPYDPMIMIPLVREIVERAVMLEHYQDKMSAIKEKLAAIQAKLEEIKALPGADPRKLEDAFGEVANEYSEDRTIKGIGKGGVAGTNFPHGRMKYPFDRAV